ncbi:hypothetical protein GCM10009753_77730 [Streptantibioticus ferralitis]
MQMPLVVLLGDIYLIEGTAYPSSLWCRKSGWARMHSSTAAKNYSNSLTGP